VSWSIVMVENPIFGPNLSPFYTDLHSTNSVFPHLKLGWLFGHVEWVWSEQYPGNQIMWWALSSFVILELSLNRLCHSITHVIFIASHHKPRSELHQLSVALFLLSSNSSLIFVTRRRNTSYQHHNFHTTDVNASKS
jgi:hypothetical protein